jgi:hypothetical protein
MPISGVSRPLLIVRIYSAAALGLITVPALTDAQETPCTRPAPGSVVTQPEELRSHDGALKLDLTYRNVKTADGREEYCYQSNDGSQAPTLRLQQGESADSAAEKRTHNAFADGLACIASRRWDANLRALRERTNDSTLCEPSFSWPDCSRSMP